ncbi:MAG TPA: hypothetical protein PK648_04895 [Verrucomicrobiales bacterium]|nr:hypothetical protein [Verrucomicrobiales bacterium]
MANGFQIRWLNLSLFSLGCLVMTLHSQDVTPEVPERRAGVIFEGSFESADITLPIQNARKTRLAAYFEWDFGVRQFTKASWKERGLTEEALLTLSREVADSIAARIEADYIRDARGVILYATVSDKDPFLTSVMLSPKLLERFREFLGDRIHVILLDRQQIYLFPATGGKLAEYGPTLVEEFRSTRLPVSLEVFLLDESGFQVVGELEREEPTLEEFPAPE